MSTPSQQRAELLRELLHFDPIDPRRTSHRDWHLPSQWNWDVNGGPRGQLHYSPDEFTGVEYADFTPEKSTFLGNGNSGEVHRVLCNGKFLARKKVLIDVNRPRKAVPNTREIQAMKRVDHHHVSQLVGLYILDNDMYSLSYPVAETSLKEYMSLRRTRDPTWVNNLIGGMGCLSNALAYMHSVGIKHRDIHNENVLMLGGCMILCDFGGSRASNSRPLPLQYEGSEDKDPRAYDVLRLGQLFEKILVSVDNGVRESDDRFDTPQQSDLSKHNLRSYSGVSKRISRVDLRCLIRAMTAADERVRPTAALVAQYLRLGYFEWAFRFGEPDGDGEILCNTCGECCMG